MQYFQIKEVIDKDLMEKFISFMNSNEENSISLFFDSMGGEVSLGKFMLRIIKNHTHPISIHIHNAYSTAFYLILQLLLTGRDIDWHFTSIGQCMMHYPSFFAKFDSAGQPCYREDKNIFKTLCKEDKEETDILAELLPMTRPEKTLFRKGQDIFFENRRLLHLFPDAKLI
jgi:hypothetical protein